jgi:predicted N-acetyltransferase YhbS
VVEPPHPSSLTPRRVVGTEYLSTITSLCHRRRLADPARFGWEAADLQWWWRQPRPTDVDGQLVFDDDHGVCAAIVTTRFRGHHELDVIVSPDALPDVGDAAWDLALEWVRSTREPVEATVPDDGPVAALLDLGFESDGEGFVDAWLDASDAPAIGELPGGFELRDRAVDATRPHHLRARNGGDVAARLQQCSLYREDLDLFVLAPDGGVAAYGVFWADPVTGVGLVEPMRTEAPHEGQGIASHVLAVGLSRLVGLGCTRLKVTSTGPLYERAGFVAGGRADLLARSARD